MARRRLEFGLADPVVVNRFLLFGIWFGLMGLLPLTLALTRLYGGASALALANGLGPKVVGSVMVVALVLTFFPPRMLRGIANAVPLCTDIGLALRLMAFAKNAPESAEDAFARLGRRK